MPRSILIALLVASSLVLPNVAQAAVIFTFAQVGNNVVATTSGSITLPDEVSFTFTYTATTNNNGQLYYVNGSTDAYGGGYFQDTGMFPSTFTATGDVFSYAGDVLYVPSGLYLPGSVVTPHSTYTWANVLLSDLFTPDLTTTPLLVYEASNGGNNSISFVAAPEPTRALLLAFGALGLLMRRKR